MVPFRFLEGQMGLLHVQGRTTDFAFDVELLLCLQHDGALIVELPVGCTDGEEPPFRDDGQ